MKHIQTCAKKNKLADDTVRTLIRKELSVLPPVASTSKSSSPADSPVPPDTLLDEVLKDGQRKKHSRRPQVLQTVKSVTETRTSILDKARLLLQDDADSARGLSSGATSRSASPPEPAHPPATQAFSRSRVAAHNTLSVVEPADTTLAFQPSNLGAVITPRVQAGIVHMGATIAGQSDISPLTQNPSACESVTHRATAAEEPPSTQVFAPSKLNNIAGPTSSGVVRGASPSQGAPYIPTEPLWYL